MNNFIEGAKREFLPKLKSAFDKGVRLFLRLVNRVDYNLTKTLQLIQEKQIQLRQYLVDREILLRQIEVKEREATYLRQEIDSIQNQANSHELEKVRMELNQKLDELLKLQRTYLNLENKIVEEQQKVEKLIASKQRLEKERNQLKLKYDELQKELSDNEARTIYLEREVEKLKEVQRHYETLLKDAETTDEIQQYEQTLNELEKEFQERTAELNSLAFENNRLKTEHKKLEQELVKKVSQITRLNASLNQVNRKLEKAISEKDALGEQLQKTEKQLTNSTKRIAVLEENINRLNTQKKKYEEQYNILQFEVHELKNKQLQDERDLESILNEYEDKIQSLKDEINNQQIELAIARAENADHEEMNEEERVILEREFEPRFATLYKNCYFHKEFLRDFYLITPSDRLKVEAIIAQLNYNYNELITTNIRKNPVRTSTRLILEYPFKTDAAGRIYLNKQNNVIHFYRISRTKNGKGKLTQANVIEWLKKHF